MLRSRPFIYFAAALLVFAVVWHIYSRWGLITVHAKEAPVAEVIKTIERQSGLTIRTNLRAETKVTMEVDNVTLREALETLAAVSDARWNLAYVFGADKPAVTNAVASLTSATGDRPEGWERSYYPVRGDYTEVPLPDPRKDLWNVREVQEKTAQAYLEQAARSVSAAFYYPTAWNPPVSGSLSSGKVKDVAPKLAKLSGGAEQEVLLLLAERGDFEFGGGDGPGRGPGGGGERRERRQARGEREPRPDRDGPPREGGGRQNRFAAMEERERAEIAKLPKEQQDAALKELEERKAFFEQMRDLPAEQRREKMEEFMAKNPGMMDRMEAARDSRDSRRTPQQQVERARKYLDRKQQARN